MPNHTPDSARRSACPSHPCARAKRWACLTNSGSSQVIYTTLLWRHTLRSHLLTRPGRASGYPRELPDSLRWNMCQLRREVLGVLTFGSAIGPPVPARGKCSFSMRRHTWHVCGRGATAQKHTYTAVLQAESPNSTCRYRCPKKCLI